MTSPRLSQGHIDFFKWHPIFDYRF